METFSYTRNLHESWPLAIFIIITLLRYYFYVTGNDLNNAGFRGPTRTHCSRRSRVIKEEEVKEKLEIEFYFNHRPPLLSRLETLDDSFGLYSHTLYCPPELRNTRVTHFFTRLTRIIVAGESSRRKETVSKP